MRNSSAYILLASALVSSCWSCAASYASTYSCRVANDSTSQALINAVTKNLPKYRFKSYFDECDSGGGRGVRFVMDAGIQASSEMLDSDMCEIAAGSDPDYPEAVCVFDGMRVNVEIEDPDIWVTIVQ